MISGKHKPADKVIFLWPFFFAEGKKWQSTVR